MSWLGRGCCLLSREYRLVLGDGARLGGWLHVRADCLCRG